MQENTFDTSFFHRSKWLVHALIISGALNIGLIAIFVNQAVKNTLPEEAIASFMTKNNSELLKVYSSFSYEKLIQELHNNEPAEEGYLKKDLALSCLVAFHHFDIDRALSGNSLEKRAFAYSDGRETIPITLFPGLNSSHYSSLQYFLQTEIWPLTSKGLFYEIKKGNTQISLKEAFFLSFEFYTLERVASYFLHFVNRNDLLELATLGEFDLLTNFAKKAKEGVQPESQYLEEILLEYLSLKSQIAANLLARLDQVSPLKKLSDDQIIEIINFTNENSPENEAFLKNILSGIRSNRVRQKAGEKLFLFANESPSDSLDIEKTVGRFIKEEIRAAIPEASEIIYTIKYGDTLWNISKQFKIDVDEIKRANQLDSEYHLKPGSTLKIILKSKETSG